MEVETSNVLNIYSKIATHFDNTRHYKWDSVEDFLNSLPKNSFILDIGCGNGRNMMQLDHKFIGLDTCEEFLTICNRKNLNTVKADMTNIPFNNNTFDALICVASFHHLSTIERRIAALKEMYRILKLDGKLFLTVWSKNQPAKTKKKFKYYGNNYVDWNFKNIILQRYYYIFKVNELLELALSVGFKLNQYYWDCGNEIFIFSH